MDDHRHQRSHQLHERPVALFEQTRVDDRQRPTDGTLRRQGRQHVGRPGVTAAFVHRDGEHVQDALAMHGYLGGRPERLDYA